jgi:hypothetical protein
MPVGGDQPQGGQHPRRLGDLIPVLRRWNHGARSFPRGWPAFTVLVFMVLVFMVLVFMVLVFTRAHISAKLYAV